MVAIAIRRSAALALSVLWLLPARAENWSVVSDTTAGVTYVDYTSIRPEGRYIKAWSKYALKGSADLSQYPYKPYSVAKELTVYDCPNHTYALKQIAYYAGNDGEVYVSGLSYTTAQLNFSDPIPGTVGEAEMQLVCAMKNAAHK
jgi:hypothetical protein